MASTKQRANRVAFGHAYGRSKAKASAQMKREAKRLEANRKK